MLRETLEVFVVVEDKLGDCDPVDEHKPKIMLGFTSFLYPERNE